MSFTTSTITTSLTSSPTAPFPTSTIQGTQTVLLALTTPFVPPPSCPTVQDASAWTSSAVWTSSTHYYTFQALFSDPANPLYAACQPSGWESVTEPLRHSYSPAVCPSDWWAIYVGTSTLSFTVTTALQISRTSKVISTAYCCKPSYAIFRTTYTDTTTPDSSLYSCSSYIRGGSLVDVPITHLSILSDAVTHTATSTYYDDFHPAWHISWEKSDTATLSPRPPTLTSGMLIPTWRPGDIVQAGVYDNNGKGKDTSPWSGGSTLIKFFYIGIPVIIAFLIALCGYSWLLSRRKKKRLAKAVALAGATGAGAASGAAGATPSIRNSTDSETGAPPCYHDGMRRSRPPAYELTPMPTREETRDATREVTRETTR